MSRLGQHKNAAANTRGTVKSNKDVPVHVGHFQSYVAAKLDFQDGSFGLLCRYLLFSLSLSFSPDKKEDEVV